MEFPFGRQTHSHTYHHRRSDDDYEAGDGLLAPETAEELGVRDPCLPDCYAIEVVPCIGDERFLKSLQIARSKGCVFVDLVNEPLAYQEQCALNGLRFHANILKVERANPIKADEVQHGQVQSAKEVQSRSGSSTNDNGLWKKLENGMLISNIANALIAVPRFYTQVLRLMNKMSILAPFHMAFPTLPLPPAAPEPLPPPLPVSTASKHPLEDLSEGESEMEFSEEKVAEKSSVFDASRVASTSRRKCLKKEAIVGPAINKEITHEEAGV
ncbi:hypothetical protein SAY87_032351 [Trapa incisa]|uniref:Uncharacterized protein n=1 Tax=Trapa incisa TaxID=236973 RepID=A0AAN7JFH9_9MYRT|nr:hypothetical protein SAY87_032351 [Trapa incisa]